MRKLSNPLIQLAIGAALVGGVVGQQASLEPVAAAGEPITTFDLTGPVGSGSFGYNVLVLSNGNFVVTDPFFDSTLQPDVGAVYLYNGTTRALISTLQGSSASDNVGQNVREVGAGNVLVMSPGWNNGAVENAGAVTWISGTTGLDGVVSETNSYVGSSTNDLVGLNTPNDLTNGNVVFLTPSWDDGAIIDAGAATWVSGNAFGGGVVGVANSLIGSTNGDLVGSKVTALTNGNYVVSAKGWDAGGVVDAGAATWGNGTSGTAGVISSANSLVGVVPYDGVYMFATALSNGNYAVGMPVWDNGPTTDVGAAVWGDGAIGTSGAIVAANSLHGSTISDGVASGIVATTDGNYVVASPNWHNGVRVGAATWANGATGKTGNVTAGNSIYGTTTGDLDALSVVPLKNGKFVISSTTWQNGALAQAGVVMLADASTTGPITTSNSLYGSHANDNIASYEPIALSSGGYLVRSPHWNNGVPGGDFGAVTWASADTPLVGAVSSSNSWVGATLGDFVGGGQPIELTNGNFVFGSTRWDNGMAVDAGALTWGSGTVGGSGVISALNSLVGSSTDDSVGSAVALSNGDYLVDSPEWSNGAITTVGAVTRGNGQTGTFGPVTEVNSFTGSLTNDAIGSQGIEPLSDGAFVVKSGYWSNTGAAQAGAATRFAAGAATEGRVTTANSLIGTVANDRVGSMVVPFTDGSFVVVSREWDRGAINRAGAVTYGYPGFALVGQITADNSVLGGMADGGTALVVGKRKTSGGAVVVSRRSENIVTLLQPYVAPPSDPNDPNDPNHPADTTDYVPLAPARLVDTRIDHATVDGLQAGGGQREIGSTLEVSVAGRGGVASDASAVTLNVTAVDSAADGFVTVFPCGEERPTASNVNVSAGATVPNAVLSRLGADGKVCVFVSQPMDLVVDSAGYFPPTSSYKPANPARVLDTRAQGVTVDGQQQGEGIRAAGSTTEVQITGRAGVPAEATTAALNVTATEADGPGYVTVFPCGSPRPLASSLNYTAGGTVANLVLSKIGADGKVCLYTQLGTHLVVDVGGYFPAKTSYESLNPARMLETRDGLSTFDAQFNGLGAIPAATVTEVKVTGRGGVPVSAATVVLNVTVTDPAAAGYVTVYPCGIEPPLASNVNYIGGQTVANATIVKVGANGNVCVYNSQKTHLVIDASGYFPPAS